MKQSNLKFTNPIVTHLVFDINSQYDRESTAPIQNSFSVEISKSDDENEAIVQLSILIGKKEFTTEEPFCIDMTIGAKFKWDNVYDEKTLQELLSKNAPALLLGYARPIIANITDAGPIPAYHLPFYNFIDD